MAEAPSATPAASTRHQCMDCARPWRTSAPAGTTCGGHVAHAHATCGAPPARDHGPERCQGEFGGRGPGSLASHTRTTSRGMPSPNFRNRIRAHRKNFETGPRLSNSLPQREGARLPPGSRRASRLLFQGFHPVPGALWAGRLSSPQTACGAARQLFGGFSGTATRRPTGPYQVGHVEEVQDMPRARLWRLLQGFAALPASSPYLMLPRRRVGGS